MRWGRLLNVSELPVANTLQLLLLHYKPCEDRNTIFRLMVYGYKELWRTITVNNSKRETICGLCVELRGQLTVDTRDGEDWQTCGDEMVAPPKTALKGSC